MMWAGERQDRKRPVADAVQSCIPSRLHPATPMDSEKDEVVRSGLRDSGASLSRSSVEVAFPEVRDHDEMVWSGLRNGGASLSNMELALPEVRDHDGMRRPRDAERRQAGCS